MNTAEILWKLIKELRRKENFKSNVNYLIKQFVKEEIQSMLEQDDNTAIVPQKNHTL